MTAALALVRRAVGRPRTRAAAVAALTAAGVLLLFVALLRHADAVAAGHGGYSPAYPPADRVGPVITRIRVFGIPAGTLLVAAATWAAGGPRRGPRLRAAVAAGALTAWQLNAHTGWLRHHNHGDPLGTGRYAALWGPLFAAPVIALVVATAAWTAAEPSWRSLSVRGRLALAAGGGAALVLPCGLWWESHMGENVAGYESTLGWGMFVWPPVAAALLAVAAWATAGRALRPVEAIRRELEDITARSLDRRVPVPASGDEITRLALTTNAILDRLENAAELQRRFVADASHELRSPLTALRTSLEAALAHPEEADWPAAVRSALDDVVRLQLLSEDLLLLARLDGGVPPGEAVVDLAGLAHDLAEEYRHRRRERPLRIRCSAAEEPVTVRGSAVQLERLLRNLLDNACRYADTAVGITVRPDSSGAVVVEVSDDGPGIPVPAREHVFERFGRLEDARTRSAGGAGLGLAISREIALLHGGTLHFADAERGARAVGRLPVPRVGGAV
ncbi:MULTISPECIES: sensor histidine kinase [Streptomyces]|uniref:sensor histidine kinase n=1 Tax=Streptomyces TaxID=1883 RepID=UPI001EE52622|nr:MULTISPECIES: HAMP domain-containing sensor histidine kinase [Streptomyces]UKW33185.1 HAMP domain-containing histidine kinase [Streptomyces sp. TYQ1024]